MKPRRTPASTGVLALGGGNEDNDLWYESSVHPDGSHVFETTWEPTDEEREAIADGGNICLMVWGRGHPPVAMVVTDRELGRASK